MSRIGRWPLATLVCVCLLHGTALAQPWLPRQGEGAVAVLYQNLYVERHIFGNNQRLDVGHIRSQAVLLDVDYGVSDRFTIGASLPFVASKYTGTRPHVHADGHTADDGDYHWGWQDVRLDARYSLVAFPVAITPFVAVNLPTHNYEYFAHSAIGLGMKEVQAGVSAGAAWSAVYVQGRYAFGRYEKVIDQRRSRSTFDAEVGWFATPRLRVFVFETAQVSHGVYDILPGFVGLTSDQIQHHDQLGRANIFDVGAGANVAITPTVDLVVALLKTLDGVNAHATKYGLTAGLSFSFSKNPF